MNNVVTASTSSTLRLENSSAIDEYDSFAGALSARLSLRSDRSLGFLDNQVCPTVLVPDLPPNEIAEQLKR